jgi:small subunit ribosomal protein S6
MTKPAPTYDLMLLLDPEAEDATRARIIEETRSSISGSGELVRDDSWGERPLSYPISRRASAQYQLFQFHAGSPQLLASLDHTLRITDGVLRFRIIKLRPGVPAAPDAGGRRSEPPTPAEQPDSGEPAPAAEAGPAAEAAPAADAA